MNPETLSRNPTAMAALLAAQEQAPIPPNPLKFPWPELRDFVSVTICAKMAEQSLLIGEKMLKQKAPGVTAEGLEDVHKQKKQFDAAIAKIDEAITYKLRAMEANAPKIALLR